jgi:uridine kinase
MNEPPANTRSDVLKNLAKLIVKVNPKDFARVAIDGIDAAGKTRLADELAPLIETLGRPVVRCSIDGFHRSRAERHRQGRESPRGYYEDSFDLPSIRREVLKPLGPGGNGRYLPAAFDFRTDLAIAATPITAPPRAVLLFDGVFLMRPELNDCWDFRVFVRVNFATSLRRTLGRDVPALGTTDDVRRLHELRYHPGQRLYLAEARPEEQADVILVNDEPVKPVLIEKS